jgi:hypothetical protein
VTMTASGGVHSLLAEYAHPTRVRWTRNPEGAVDNERTNPSGHVAAERHYAEYVRTARLPAQSYCTERVRSAPTLGELHTAPEEGLQRAARESLAKNSEGGACANK